MKVMMKSNRTSIRYIGNPIHKTYEFAQDVETGLWYKAAKEKWDLNCQFLSHVDGIDKATEATDVSQNELGMTFYNGAELDTSIKKFGESSIVFNNTQPTVETPVTSLLNVSKKSFTIDMQVYIPNANFIVNFWYLTYKNYFFKVFILYNRSIFLFWTPTCVGGIVSWISYVVNTESIYKNKWDRST